jgi:predicted nuclease of predicted toxin-antitoxin system
MKLLLDENLPKRLKIDFPDHEVYTVREMAWNGVKDVQLLSFLDKHGFHALLTFDKNIRYQQNFVNSGITIFILSAHINSYQELTKLPPLVRHYLEKVKLPVGPVAIFEKMTI